MTYDAIHMAHHAPGQPGSNKAGQQVTWVHHMKQHSKRQQNVTSSQFIHTIQCLYKYLSTTFERHTDRSVTPVCMENHKQNGYVGSSDNLQPES